MREQERFKVAPLDSYATRITTGVAYLGGLLMLPLLFAYLGNVRWGGLLIPVAFAVVLALLLLLAYAGQPVSYTLEDRHLVIKRTWMRALRIPLDHIQGVSFASSLADIPRRGVRFAFNPGIFGYQGPVYLDPYGRVFLLATNRERLVSLARQPAPPLILSPDRPRAFMQALSQRLSEEPDPRSATEPEVQRDS